MPTPDGPIRLSAVADVKVDSIESTSIARADGRPALSVAVLKDTDADAVEISHTVRDQIPSLEQKLGNNTTITTIFDQAPLIEQSIHDLAIEGLLGLAFAVLVILFFLFSIRATLITAISIPLSLLIAMIGVQLSDYSLNIFTLAGLTVAVGRVVDDSIVVVENIKRRDLGHRTLRPSDVLASVKEVAGAVTASTLTTVTVFAPVAIVSGVVGELFRPFAITIAVALGASLLVSMTIVPVLAYWFLRGGARRRQLAATAAEKPGATEASETHTAEETKVTRLQRGYLPILRFGLTHPLHHTWHRTAGLRRNAGLGNVAEDRLHWLGHRPNYARDPAEAAARHEVVDDQRRGRAGRESAARRPSGKELSGDDRRQPRTGHVPEHQHRGVHGPARRGCKG